MSENASIQIEWATAAAMLEHESLATYSPGVEGTRSHKTTLLEAYNMGSSQGSHAQSWQVSTTQLQFDKKALLFPSPLHSIKWK